VIHITKSDTTQRFSKGGVYVPADGTGSLWVENGGKTWDTLGKLRAHITSHMSKYPGDYGTDMSNWEVVEYRMMYVDAKPIHQIVTPEKLVKLLTQ
jgi:hypothetical protein